MNGRSLNVAVASNMKNAFVSVKHGLDVASRPSERGKGGIGNMGGRQTHIKRGPQDACASRKHFKCSVFLFGIGTLALMSFEGAFME